MKISQVGKYMYLRHNISVGSALKLFADAEWLLYPVPIITKERKWLFFGRDH